MAKNPISSLMEYLQIKKLGPPVFRDSQHGPPHQPTFRMKVIAGGHESEANGKTKQEAKANACKLLLDVLKMDNGLKNIKLEAPSTKCQTSVPRIAQGAEAVAIANGKGDLLCLCQRNRLPEPEYQLMLTEGPDHMKRFTVECSLLNIRETAQSFTVKNAEKEAAFKVLKKLENKLKNSEFRMKMPQVEDLSISQGEAIERYEELKDPFKMMNKACFKDSHKVFEDLPEKSPTLLKFVQNRKEGEDPVNLVQEIAHDLKVNLTVRDMNRSVLKNELNLQVFLMQLATVPPLSSLGFNKKEAAERLLNTIAVMCT